MVFGSVGSSAVWTWGEGVEAQDGRGSDAGAAPAVTVPSTEVLTLAVESLRSKPMPARPFRKVAVLTVWSLSLNPAAVICTLLPASMAAYWERVVVAVRSG